ncbi:MAG: TIGR02757 family protein [Candidatus Hydrogenedentota bacterium]|nr:MAG: TIGR02757 family protein [Candidatus Hydrogenedentota bacterium]
MDLVLLKKRLDALCQNYDRTYLPSDPLMFLHRYDDPADIEVVGLVSSSLAYGQVKVIQRNIPRVLDLMGRHPARYVRNFDARGSASRFSGISHRFNRGPDLVLLLHFMKQMLHTKGSIGEFFRVGYEPDALNIKDSLSSFVERVLALDCTPVYSDGILPKDAGVRFLFPSPLGKSACKRLNLYLRWMVRRGDGLDFGLWDFASPSQLVIPLDTHVARICSLIGLAKRKSSGWPMAIEITENLKKLDGIDPVRYDFAICRLGILDKCPRVPSPRKCGECEIRKLCTR